MPASPSTPPKATAPDQISVATRLGWVSFFNDCSSEVIARAMPLLLTSGLGMSPTFVGAIEGGAEAISILLKGFSGWISDRMPSRKPLVVLGYSLAVLSRVFLLAAHLPIWFGLARILDRTGKGLRSAPRDAMIADGAASGMSGKAFGITRFLDALGAITGITVILAMGLGDGPVTEVSFRRLVLAAVPFGVLAVLFLIVAVPRITRVTKTKATLSWHVPVEVRGYLAAVGVFALGNSSDAFLVLKAHELGFSFRAILLMMLCFNALAAALAVPVGKLTDKIGRISVLAFGWLVYAAVYALFASVQSMPAFALALFVYGAFYGFTEGTEKALLADILPAEKRGTGFGSLQLVLGLAALPASVITGWLMTTYGSRLAFNVAAGFAGIGALWLLLWWRASGRRQILNARAYPAAADP